MLVLESQTIRKLQRKDGMLTPSYGPPCPNWVDDGQEEVRYRVEVDTKILANMGCRAAKNKSGKCVDGPVVVTVLSRKRV